MILSLKEICIQYVFKNGVQGRETLPEELAKELIDLEQKTKLNISGSNYADYHVQERYMILQLDINWTPGSWKIQMQTRSARGELEVTAGKCCYLASGWSILFLYVHGDPFPCQPGRAIILKDFHVDTGDSSVTFDGQFYNHCSGTEVAFRTKFGFSVTNHFLKVTTVFFSGGTYNEVGKRFLKQPDTPQGDLFRYGAGVTHKTNVCLVSGGTACFTQTILSASSAKKV